MKRHRGRPPQSRIRQNITQILSRIGVAYGYQISKLYQETYPPTTRRVIYYHLHKGVQLHEFEIERISNEKGDYSWGSSVEKTYYKLGKRALDVKGEVAG